MELLGQSRGAWRKKGVDKSRGSGDTPNNKDTMNFRVEATDAAFDAVRC